MVNNVYIHTSATNGYDTTSMEVVIIPKIRHVLIIKRVGCVTKA